MSIAARLLSRLALVVIAGLGAGLSGLTGLSGCTCESSREACTRDGECGDGEVCYGDDRCVPREVAQRVGAVVGEECAVVGGVEVGCEADEWCRMGFCRGADDVDGGHGHEVDGGIDGAMVGCSTGTAADMAPLFGGAAEASADGADAVVVSWIAAADETVPADLRYHVYVATTAGAQDLTAPTTTVVGQTTARLTGLTAGTTYHVVVRAEDAAGQIDCNTTERSATPRAAGACVSYTADVKPILDGRCLGCHSGAAPPAGLRLDSHANVLAGGITGTEVVACQPTASLIYLKVSSDTPPVGVRMPQGGPYLSAAQIQTIHDWIAGGAPLDCPTDPGACSDATAPTFAGLTSATLTNDSTARLCWAAGADDVTPAGQLLYDVYQATAPGGQVFTSPPETTTTPGATCVDVAGLTPAQQYCWVTRARDGAGNRDGNTVERCLTTPTASCIDYATVVQPVFNAECVHCHAGAAAPRGLRLDSYAGVIAGGQTGNTVVSCQPSSSLLYQKVSMATPPVGVRMPADGPPYLTAAQQSAIQQWISEGARSSCGAPDPCSDTTPPSFAGATTATAINATTIEVCWAPGSDNLTPAAGLIYDAYTASAPGGQALTGAPTKSSAAGATCVRIDALSPSSQQCVVVRARDGAGNRDSNRVERCVTTPAVPPGCVDYATMIQPLFDRNCTRCHAGDRPPQWLRLDSYDHALAGSAKRNAVAACNAGASLIVNKIGATPTAGRRMPYDGPPYLTSAQLAMVSQWINQGAQRTCGEPAACGDTTAPSFIGAASASAVDSTTVRVCWPQATDAVTAAASLRYDVYQSATAGGENYSLPPADSVVGQLCTDVRVGPASTTCFVVRARDLAGNRSVNTVERCATTAAATCAVEYDALIQPILTARCTHCHQGEDGPRFLDLRTYGGALAGGAIRDAVDACDWAGSLLNTKTAGAACGARMPADGPPWLAASERSLLKAWIDSGARRTCADPAVCGDTTAPSFAGATTATATSATTIEVCWSPASDAGSAADSVVYEVYDGATAAGIAFNRAAPYAVAGGATCLAVTVPTGQQTCLAVRARDLAGNRDGNTVARCATPAGACFAYDDVIQPLFDARCVHCHSGSNPPRGIRWDSYANAVANDGEVRPCDAGSKLLDVVDACDMPADTTSGACRACLTSSQNRLLRQWVLGGADAACPWGGC